jgi:hypothetical protein
VTDSDCNDGNPCTDDQCISNTCVNDPIGQLSIELELEALAANIVRDLEVIITTCDASVDSRIIPATFGTSGTATLLLLDVNAAAQWLAVTEGHTLRKLTPLTFTDCAASVNLSGTPDRLAAGDFHTAIVPKDNLVDITDFAILAANFNELIDPSLGTGADATGDGVQGPEDFAAIVQNFFRVGDAPDGCGATAQAIPGDRRQVRQGPGLRGSAPRLPARSIHVHELPFENAEWADLTGDHIVDVADIRAFAQVHGFLLTGAFCRSGEGATRHDKQYPLSP